MPKSKSRRKKAPKRVLALPDLEHAKTAVLSSLTSASGQRTYEHAIREFVVQPYGGASIPDSPRTARICASHDQSSVGRGPAHRVRGSRRGPSERRIGGRYSSGQGGAADWRTARELADTRSGPAAPPRARRRRPRGSCGIRRWSRC